MQFDRRMIPVLLLGAAAIWACADTQFLDPMTSTEVGITPDTVTFSALGDSTELSVSIGGADGTADVAGDIAWASLDPEVATVSEDGMVRALTTGRTGIVGVLGEQADTVVVFVVQEPTSLAVTPRTDTVGIDGTIRLTAAAADRNGHEIAELTVTWASNDDAVATVNAEGEVVGVASGETEIVALVAALADTAVVVVQEDPDPDPDPDPEPDPGAILVTITPAGGTLNAIGDALELSAVVEEEGAGERADASVSWTSLDGGIATVDADGRVVAEAVGNARIVAASEGAADTVTVVVRQVVASVSVSPVSRTLEEGLTASFTATAADSNGVEIEGASFEWTSSDPSTAAVDEDGGVTAVAEGSAVIAAKVDDVTGSAEVTVEAAPDPGAYMFRDAFESGDLSHNENGTRWTSSKNIVVTDDIAYSGEYSLSFFYAGDSDPCRDGHAEQRFTLGRDLQEVWVEYYVYLPDGTEGLGARFDHRSPSCPRNDDPNGVVSNNKFFHLWDVDYQQKEVGVAWEFRRMGGGDSYLYAMSLSDALQDRENEPSAVFTHYPTWSPAITDDTPGTVRRGHWAQVRYHVRLSSDYRTEDGLIEMWLDGERVMHYSNLLLAGSAGANNFLRNGYVMGWANSGFANDTYVFVDDFKVYDSPPGW